MLVFTLLTSHSRSSSVGSVRSLNKLMGQATEPVNPNETLGELSLVNHRQHFRLFA